MAVRSLRLVEPEGYRAQTLDSKPKPRRGGGRQRGDDAANAPATRSDCMSAAPVRRCGPAQRGVGWCDCARPMSPREAAMKNGLALSTVLGLAMRAACAQSPPPPGQKLAAAELAKVESNATAIGSDSYENFAIYTAPDGTFAIKMGSVDDTGTYKITDDGHVCLKYHKAFGGNEYCNTIYRDGQTYRAVAPNGAIVGTYTMTPGNPRNLQTAGAR
jgi:hypothetical protein